jgi:hypothetical protein
LKSLENGPLFGDNQAAASEQSLTRVRMAWRAPPVAEFARIQPQNLNFSQFSYKSATGLAVYVSSHFAGA